MLNYKGLRFNYLRGTCEYSKMQNQEHVGLNLTDLVVDRCDPSILYYTDLVGEERDPSILYYAIQIWWLTGVIPVFCIIQIW